MEVNYCSADCQSAAWPIHKKSCKADKRLKAILGDINLLSGGPHPLIAALQPFSNSVEGLSPSPLAKLFTLRAMVAEKLQHERPDRLESINMYKAAFELLLSSPGIIDQSISCNGHTLRMRAMLASYSLDWTGSCCRYCINLESPNAPRTLPEPVLLLIRSLADSQVHHPSVRLLCAWAATTSLQFAGLDPRLVGMGISMTNSSSAFFRDRLRYSRLCESLWTPQVRAEMSRDDRAKIEMIVAETRGVNREVAGMNLGQESLVVVSELP